MFEMVMLACFVAAVLAGSRKVSRAMDAIYGGGEEVNHRIGGENDGH